MLELQRVKSAVEALLFVSGEGLSPKDILSGLNEKLQDKNIDMQMILDSLVDEYLEREGGIFIEQSAGKYRFRTRPEVYADIQVFLKEKKQETLSKAMLEALAIIAYKQPLTLYEVEEIRGVNSRALVSSLLQKKLIKTLGQKEAPGRPTLYGTSKEFLEYFGLNSLEDLPSPQDVKELNFDEL